MSLVWRRCLNREMPIEGVNLNEAVARLTATDEVSNESRTNAMNANAPGSDCDSDAAAMRCADAALSGAVVSRERVARGVSRSSCPLAAGLLLADARSAACSSARLTDNARR